MKSKVFIVGAGPGDPELLTVKAARLISEADIILHDHLVGSEILRLARPECKMVFVGKQNKNHLVVQEEINTLLVRAAEQYKNVVRLKGGDPFVFGRGGEEEITLNQNNISFETVPGISSSVAGPTYAGIPVTHRNVARSFTVVTGHQAKNHKDTIDWKNYAAVETLVVMMGVSKRDKIASDLISAGRPASEPVAYIEQATTSNQKVIVSTLGEVAKGGVEVKSPAVTVIGPVVHLREQLKWFGDSQVLEENQFIPVV